MALQVTSIGPLPAEVRMPNEDVVHALVVAFRWNDVSPGAIDGYLALVRAGHPSELVWIRPEEIQRFR